MSVLCSERCFCLAGWPGTESCVCASLPVPHSLLENNAADRRDGTAGVARTDGKRLWLASWAFRSALADKWHWDRTLCRALIICSSLPCGSFVHYYFLENRIFWEGRKVWEALQCPYSLTGRRTPPVHSSISIIYPVEGHGEPVTCSLSQAQQGAVPVHCRARSCTHSYTGLFRGSPCKQQHCILTREYECYSCILQFSSCSSHAQC